MAAARLITPQGAGELVTFVQDLSLRIQFRAIFDADLAPPAAPRVCDDDGNGSGEEQERQQQQQQQPAAATHGAVRRPTSPTVERMARLSASIRVALAQFRAVSFAPRGEAGGASQRGEQRSSVMAFVRRFTNARRQRAQLSARIERHFGPRKRDAAGAAFAAMLRGLSRGRLAPRRGAAPGSGDSASSASGSDPLRFDEVERLVAMRCAVADDASAAESAESTSTTTTTMPWRDVMADMLGSDAGLSEQDMTVLAKDLVAAGSDTTASAVTMTIFELLRASMAARMSAGPPEEVSSPPSITVFDEAIAEAIRLDPDSLVDLRSVQELLPFTTACTKEALRLHPPAPLFWRTANEDTELGGCKVSRGAVVVTSAAVLGRDRRQWGDDADHFRPTRFLLKAEEATPERHPFAYLPFGAGQRSCLGRRVAMAQVPVIVALILRTAALRQVEQGLG